MARGKPQSGGRAPSPSREAWARFTSKPDGDYALVDLSRLSPRSRSDIADIFYGTNAVRYVGQRDAFMLGAAVVSVPELPGLDVLTATSRQFTDFFVGDKSGEDARRTRTTASLAWTALRRATWTIEQADAWVKYFPDVHDAELPLGPKGKLCRREVIQRVAKLPLKFYLNEEYPATGELDPVVDTVALRQTAEALIADPEVLRAVPDLSHKTLERTALFADSQFPD